MSKFFTYEELRIIAWRLQEQESFGLIGAALGKDRTSVEKEIKKYSYDKKVVVRDTLKTHADTAFHAKKRISAIRNAHTCLSINAVFVQNEVSIVLSLPKTSVL